MELIKEWDQLPKKERLLDKEMKKVINITQLTKEIEEEIQKAKEAEIQRDKRIIIIKIDGLEIKITKSQKLLLQLQN